MSWFLAHGVGVVKWMNGIRARSLLGGCLCDVPPGWTRLPLQPDLNGKSSHRRTGTSTYADAHIDTQGLVGVDCKQYAGKRHQNGVDEKCV